jgi:hypothetical protein
MNKKRQYPISNIQYPTFKGRYGFGAVGVAGGGGRAAEKANPS